MGQATRCCGAAPQASFIAQLFLSVVYLRLMLEDRAGGGVDLVAIFHIAGFELDFVDELSVLIIQLNVHVIRLIFTQAYYHTKLRNASVFARNLQLF